MLRWERAASGDSRRVITTGDVFDDPGGHLGRCTVLASFLGDEEAEPVDLRRTMVVQRAATGKRPEIPREVRNHFIAVQLAARDFC